MPPFAWLALLAEREMGMEPPAPAAEPGTEPLLVLSREEFESAVRSALRCYAKPDRLRDNPLLKTRLLANAGASRKEKAEALRNLIKETASGMKAAPREMKLLRALHYTYFSPLETQELVAEKLNLPYSTYRRHLVRGVKRLTELLWLKEIGEG